MEIAGTSQVAAEVVEFAQFVSTQLFLGFEKCVHVEQKSFGHHTEGKTSLDIEWDDNLYDFAAADGSADGSAAAESVVGCLAAAVRDGCGTLNYTLFEWLGAKESGLSFPIDSHHMASAEPAELECAVVWRWKARYSSVVQMKLLRSMIATH